MKTKAVRLHGENDLRLDTFELPEMQEDQVLVKLMTDSVCMSSWKLSQQGKKHKRVVNDLKEPVIIGHEMCGTIIKVGDKWKDKYKAGQKFTIQPSLNYKNTNLTVGYSYPDFGGDSTYSIIPSEVMEMDCLIPVRGDSFFQCSLTEPVSCVIAGFNRMYHTFTKNHSHVMGVKEGGNLIIMGACGPMGLEAIDYAMQLDPGPSTVVCTDISEERLARAENIFSVREHYGKKLVFFNSARSADVVGDLMDLTDGHGYDDVLIFTPVKSVIEQGDKILGQDGCLLFFAGPVDHELSAEINMYNIHYAFTHYVGYSGCTNDDFMKAIELTEQGRISPSLMVTHVGGLDSAAETTLNLPKIPGGKKLIYTQIDMPLTAIDDFEKLGQTDPLFARLAETCKNNHNCWNSEAEKILLDHFQVNTNA